MSPFRSSLTQVLSLVDAKVGVINSVSIFRNLDRDPHVACALARAASMTPQLGFDFDNNGGACALTPANAALRACGETIERYSSSIIPWSALRRTTASELRKRYTAFDADRFYAFSKAQHAQSAFAFREPSPDDEKFWVAVAHTETDEIAYVPASCVYLPYTFPKEPMTHAPISTGLAAGLGTRDCLEKAAAEIIERDALMIRWKCAMPAPAIDQESCRAADTELARLLASTDHLPGDWRLSLLTLDIETPVVAAAFINRDGRPMTSFGIAANANPITAARGAVCEALLSRFLLNRSAEANDPNAIEPNDFRTLRRHLFGHAVSERLKGVFLRLLGAKPTLSMTDIVQLFGANATPLRALAKADLGAFWVDVTAPDVGAAGIRVVRVLVPDAEPLDNDHEMQHLGGRRLKQWAKRQGITAFNPEPRRSNQ